MEESKEKRLVAYLEKIPFEVYTLIFFIILYLSNNIMNMNYAGRFSNYSLVFKLVNVVKYVSFIILIAIAIKRVKAKAFWDNTLIGKMSMKIEKGIRKVNTEKPTWKIVLLSIVYIYLMLGILFMTYNGRNTSFGVLVDIIITVVWITLINRISKRKKSLEKIEEGLREIYEGNLTKKIDEEELSKEFKSLAGYINGISNGFENAVQEGIKSERLKTELITNVSHDIKTPLTSIINYVDLLKKENIKNKKAKEYIEILDTKSQRLKRLTEDLVEASKASSGNVKLNLEKINISELINQTTGEFEDRFKEKKLEIITQIPEEEILIEADSRYMYRVIENLFSNISKYALEASRVYVDVFTDKEKVKISIKNISKEKLNISAEELMQRFVRGDKSRTTEGSGLGLSISQSLTELQKGKFSIQIDGDLFKVELEFERI